MSLISGDVFLLLPIYRYHETWDFLTHEKNMHNSLWNLIHMPICTHARIFSDFNLSFRFLTKIINRGTNNRSNTTAELLWGEQIFPWRCKESQQCDTKPAGTKNCDHDRWREIRKSNDIGEDRTEFRALSAGFHCYGHTEGLTLWIA